MNPNISRRSALKGLGTVIALPWLESLAVAAPATPSLAAPAAKRLAFCYVPNGMHMADFTPATVGKLDKLPDILAPLESVKAHVNVMTGLKLDKASIRSTAPIPSSTPTSPPSRLNVIASIRNWTRISPG